MTNYLDILLLIVVFINLLILSTSQIDWMIRLIAVQGFLLSIMPLYISGFSIFSILFSVIMLSVKSIAIPALLFKAMRDIKIKREDDPLIGSVFSMLIGVVLTGSIYVWQRKTQQFNSPLLALILPVTISTLVTGIIVLVTRVKAITQVIGYLIFENGIFIFGLLLMHKVPFIVEMGILLDLWVGIFVMGIILHHIAEHFSTMDTRKMNSLKD